MTDDLVSPDGTPAVSYHATEGDHPNKDALEKAFDLLFAAVMQNDGKRRHRHSRNGV
jgi:hypothetical protein